MYCIYIYDIQIFSGNFLYWLYRNWPNWPANRSVAVDNAKTQYFLNTLYLIYNIYIYIHNI